MKGAPKRDFPAAAENAAAAEIQKIGDIGNQRVQLKDVQLAIGEDGKDILLGQGAYGRVSLLLGSFLPSDLYL